MAARPTPSSTDLEAMLWAIACCWLAVWGNYLLLYLGVTVFYIVPIDAFAVPAAVTVLFWILRRRDARPS